MLEANLALLETKDKALYEILISYEESGNMVESCVAKNGDRIVSYNGTMLNSTYDPAKETDRFMQEYDNLPENTSVLMFGISNAKYLRWFLDNNQGICGVMIYEPSIDILLNCLKDEDMTDILINHNIWIKAGTKQYVDCVGWMQRNILAYNYKFAKCIILPKYNVLFPEESERFKQDFENAVIYSTALANTAVENGKAACKNSINNVRYMNQAKCFGEFKNKIKCESAIVVSAGPSLEKNAKYIMDAKGKIIIMAVDSSLPYLLKNDILPDVIISIDHSKPIELFQDERIKEIPFIFGQDVNEGVLKSVKLNKLIVGTNDNGIWKSIAEKAGQKLYSLRTGGSVATDAIAILHEWGMKNIILVGQDLAVTESKAHAGEAESILKRNKRTGKQMPGISEEYVIVPDDFEIYLKWIESFAEKNADNCTIIDSTEGGVRKKNTIVMDLKEAIVKYGDDNALTSDFYDSVEPMQLGAHNEAIIEVLHEMIVRCRNLSKQCASGAADCTRAKKMFQTNACDIKFLKKTDAMIAKLNYSIEHAIEREYYLKYAYQLELDLTDVIARSNYAEHKEGANDIDISIDLLDSTATYYRGIEQAGRELAEIAEACIGEIQ